MGRPGGSQLALAIARLRQACLRFWSWSVSDEPRLARLGQEYLFEQVDRVLWLSKDVVLEEQDALVVLRGLRARSAALVGDGLRHLFLERNRSGLFPCFQGLFLAVGLPELRTFDGPQAPALEPALRGRFSSARPMGRSHAAVRARAAEVEIAGFGEQTLEDSAEGSIDAKAG